MKTTTKKPSPVDQTGNGKGTRRNVGKVTKPHGHYNTETGAMQRVSDYLRKGRKNALPMRMLTRLTGCTEREVRAMIHQERRRGVPILADMATGYYLPANREEKDRWLRTMYHRAHEILTVAQAVREGRSLE